MTAKHNMATNGNTLQQPTSYVCDCGKAYMHRASLYKHEKKCTSKIPIVQPISDTNQINDILTNAHAAQIAQLTTLLNEQSVAYATQIAETEARAKKQEQQIKAHAEDLVRQSEAHIAKQITIMVEAVQKIANSR